MVINKKIIRTMMEHKSQYIGSIILIAISCLLFSLFNPIGEEAVGNLENFRKNNVLEDANFIVQQNIKDVSKLESQYDCILEQRKSYDYSLDKSSTLRLLSATNKIDKYAVLNGSPLKNNDDLLIDPNFADAHDLSIGDQIKIQDKTFKIVGFVALPDYVYPLKSSSDVSKNPKTFGVGVVSKENFESFPTVLNFYSVKFNNEVESSFKKNLNAENVIVNWVDKKDNMRISFVDSDLKGIAPMGQTMPIAILLLTCVLISIVLSRLLKGEYIQIGTLYALGYRKKEIVRHYLSYPIAISLAGSIIGTVLGTFFIKSLLAFISTFYSIPITTVNYNIKYILISIFLPFVFLVPTALIAIFSALKLSPLDLMRGGKTKVKINVLERNLKLNRFKFNTKFKIREVVRHIPRTILMSLGVAFASMLLLIGFGTNDSMMYLMNDNFNSMYHYKYNYVYNTLQFDSKVHGDKVAMSPFTVENDKSNTSIMGYGVSKDEKFITLKDLKGNVLNMDGVIISKSIADKLDIKVGDSLNLKNRLNAKKFSVRVDAIASVYLGNYIYMPIEKFNTLSGYPKGSYLEVYSDKKLNIDKSKLMSSNTKQDILDSNKALMKPFQSMIAAIGIIAFVIGLVVIYIVTSMMIEENTQNISLLKIFGYSKREIYSLILNSNTIFVILGYIVSIPVIFAALASFFNVMTKDMNMLIPVKIKTMSLVLGFIIMLITYELSKLMNKRKLNKIEMGDILKNRIE